MPPQDRYEEGSPQFNQNSRAAKPISSRLTELMVPERSMQTTGLDEALAACKRGFHYSREEIVAHQLVLEEDLSLHFGGKRYRLTETALDQLCTIFRIPVPFAYDLTTFLLSLNVAGLKHRHDRIITLIYHDDVVVGVVDPQKWCGRSRSKTRRSSYEPVRMVELLSLLANMGRDLASDDGSTRITIADSGMQVELLSPDLTVEPEVGDITRIGLVLTASETGGPLPVARGHALRLACKNGATLPTKLGLLRFSHDWRVKRERRLEAFAAGLRSLTLDLEGIQDAYARLVSSSLSDLAFYNLYRQVRYVYRHAGVSDQRADYALGVGPAQRQFLIRQVLRRQEDLRRRSRTVYAPAVPTDLSAWRVFTTLTETARDETYHRRVDLEKVAGGMLNAVTGVAAEDPV